jgi:hypothetical protein
VHLRRRRQTGRALACLLELSLRELWRNKLGMVLLVGIPAIFIAVVVWTAGRLPVPIKLFYAAETLRVVLPQKSITLVFASAAVTGFLVAYYSLVLYHQDFEYYRYGVFLGLRPGVFAGARFLLFLLLSGAIALLITTALGLLIELEQPAAVFLGFLLTGVTYGACGGIIGSLTRSFLPALLIAALLVDLDAAWLQNPVYYSWAQDSALIHCLPAFYPCQALFAAAFTPRGNLRAVLGALAYAGGLTAVLFFIVHVRFRGVWRRHSAYVSFPPGRRRERS